MYMISVAVARIEYFFSGFVFSFLKDFITFADVFRMKGKTSAEVAQLVEHQLPKLRVAGSNPVFRSKRSLQTSFFVGGGREGAGRASNPHPADNGNAPANGRIPISAWRDARPSPTATGLPSRPRR